ncbi:hypothetical protein [Clostridium sp. JS66]|uniref:hypothetical protein n=1 Tax=Clostridium sp. JS66 TaxID=3064705 RepID=UPI00298EB328|nr:hypothetical protein [Clostridium sp. JS66]WPC43285.1 hypothetical protein Q6H37_07380 [Clostridium sp. JS66]
MFNLVFVLIFSITILVPIYSYVMYPILLKLILKKSFVYSKKTNLSISIVIPYCGNELLLRDKIESLRTLLCHDEVLEVIISTNKILRDKLMTEYSQVIGLQFVESKSRLHTCDINMLTSLAIGDIVVLSNVNTIINYSTIACLINKFSCANIGCVCGRIKYINHDEDSDTVSESLIFRYENYIKVLESKIGILTGVNPVFYAIRKSITPIVPNNIINADLYIVTYILNSKFDIVYDTDTWVVEKQYTNCKNKIKNHIREGMGYYQILREFPRLLLPSKIGFVYVSHRVIRWICPFLMILTFISNVILSFYSIVWVAVLLLQIVLYMGYMVFIYIFKDGYIGHGPIGKILSFGVYFISLNIDYFWGWVRLIKAQK